MNTCISIPDTSEVLAGGEVRVLAGHQELLRRHIGGVLLVQEVEVWQREQGLEHAPVNDMPQRKPFEDLQGRWHRPSHIWPRILPLYVSRATRNHVHV